MIVQEITRHDSYYWQSQQLTRGGVWSGGGSPAAAQASSRGIRVYIGIGICLALMFIL